MMDLAKFGEPMKMLVSVLIISAFLSAIGALFALSYYKVDFADGVKEVMLVLIGVLAGAFKDVSGYWIGSSHGSARKTELAARQPDG